jgi:CBS domain-containing protein
MEIADPISSVLVNKGSDLWTTSPEITVFDAIKVMSQKNIGALPVMAGTKLVGIVSERDYMRKVVLEGKSSKETMVSEIMTTTLFTATTRDSVEKSMFAMTQHRVRHLPVLDDGQLIGIVTIGDLVKWTISAQGAVIDQLEGYIKGSYPG